MKLIKTWGILWTEKGMYFLNVGVLTLDKSLVIYKQRFGELLDIPDETWGKKQSSDILQRKMIFVTDFRKLG